MISLSNTTEQTVASGQSITFNTVLSKTGCAECHRKNTGSVKLCAKNAIYQIEFTANVTGATASTPVQLTVQLGGDNLPETNMIYTPATADAVGNVSVSFPVRNNCCDYDRISVVNTGTTDITVSANPLLFIHRIA
jgi:hypothetical protein